MRLLDTNILIRYLTNDHPKLASRCEALFEKISNGKEKVMLNHLVIAEAVWVLEGQYHYPEEKIAEILLRLVNTPHIEIIDKEIIIATFSIWQLAHFKVDYIDAYNAACVTSKKLNGIYSYDADFDRLNILRQEP